MKQFEHKEGKKAELVPFMQYYPTYSSMDKQQKEWYFYWRSQVRKGIYLDTDLSSRKSLIACEHTPEEMATIFGADSVGFLPIEDVFKLGVGGLCNGYCAACFDGNYPTEEPIQIGINKYDQKITQK